jgi:hypothetical protein
MNVVEINPGSLETIARYVETTIALTLLTTWIVIALQPYSSIHENSGGGVWRRIAWPFYFSNTLKAYYRQVRPSSPQADNASSLRSPRRRGPTFPGRREGSLHEEEEKIGD